MIILIFFLKSLFVFSQYGRSSLHKAVLGRDVVIVKKLLQAGADVNLRDRVSKMCCLFPVTLSEQVLSST